MARQVSFNGIIALGETVVLISGGIDISVGAVLDGGGPDDEVATAWRRCCRRRSAALRAGSWRHQRIAGDRIGIPPFIATLGSMTVVQGLMLTYTQQQPIQGISRGSRSSASLGRPSTGALPHRVAIFCYWWLNHTRSGRNIYAVGAIPTRRDWRASIWICTGSCHTSSAASAPLVRGAARLTAQYLDHSYRPRHPSSSLGRGNHGRRQPSWWPRLKSRHAARRSRTRHALERHGSLGRLYLLPDRHSRGDPGRRGGHRQLLHEPDPRPDAAAGARGVGLPCGEKGVFASGGNRVKWARPPWNERRRRGGNPR